MRNCAHRPTERPGACESANGAVVMIGPYKYLNSYTQQWGLFSCGLVAAHGSESKMSVSDSP